MPPRISANYESLMSGTWESDESESESGEEGVRLNIDRVEEGLLKYCKQETHPTHHDHFHSREQASHREPHKCNDYPCRDTHATLPDHPSTWPQRPVMLRPSPKTTTKIRGIRYANSLDYQQFPGFCPGCTLPVNTGKELPGQSLVIDFESKHFIGTLLMRIKEAPPANPQTCGTTSYFDGKKRRFQAVVKGCFKNPLKMSECVSGQLFERPAGKLPPRWIISSFLMFISKVAPNLEATFDSDTPRFVTPTVATAKTVLEKPKDASVHNHQSQDIEEYVEEPQPEDECSVMQYIEGAKCEGCGGDVAKREKVRRKAYSHVFAEHADEPRFQLDKEYTFEFYQHLLLFGDTMAVDMGRVIGKVDLAPVTDGQTLKFMTSHRDPDTGDLDALWSFDIWHESYYEHAKAAKEGG